MVAFRNETSGNFYVTDWWDNGNNQIAFGRGDKGFVVINREGGTLNRTFQTSLPAGTYCNVIDGEVDASGSCTGSTITVNSDGSASINVNGNSAAAIHAGAICTAAECSSSCEPNCGGFQKTYNQLYFRGTPNGWGTTSMDLVADYTWEIETNFGSASSERFKFDVHGDWSLNFGDNNNDGIAEQTGSDIYITEGAGDYTITFNDQTKAYSVVKDGSTGCSPVDVTFNAAVYTNWGENVYVVGNVPELGNWNPANGFALSPDNYPTWSGTITLPHSTIIEYKYVKLNGGNATWQSGANRTVTTPCSGSIVVNNGW